MAASSSCSEVWILLGRRRQRRAHDPYCPGRPRGSRLPGLFDGKPTCTAGAQRRGAEAARQALLRLDHQSAPRVSAWWRHDVYQDAELHRTRDAMSAQSVTPSCADCVAVNTLSRHAERVEGAIQPGTGTGPAGCVRSVCETAGGERRTLPAPQSTLGGAGQSLDVPHLHLSLLGSGRRRRGG